MLSQMNGITPITAVSTLRMGASHLVCHPYPLNMCCTKAIHENSCLNFKLEKIPPFYSDSFRNVFMNTHCL